MKWTLSQAARLLALAGLMLLVPAVRAQSGGDYDGDGDIDGDDFWYWSGCMPGPTGEVPNPDCATFDFDQGTGAAVDLSDFATFGRVFATTKVPLGGGVSSTTQGGYFRVYVPTKWGGVLTVATTSGTISGLKHPDGSPFANGTETGANQHGWYTFHVNGSTSYTVSATFVQTGQAAVRPWNFYYWPKKGEYIREPVSGGNGVANTTALATDEQVIPPGQPAGAGADIVRCGSDGNLETTPAGDDQKVLLYALYRRINPWRPLDKYEQVYGGYPRNWEAQNDRSNDDWAGHCLGASMASILKNQPTTQPSGSPFQQDELEALWAEVGENGAPGAYTFDDWLPDPNAPGPPVPGPDPTDAAVSKLHDMFETWIRGAHSALQSNLRAAPNPYDPNGPLDPNAVWNHAVHKFEANYAEAPGGNERVVYISNLLAPNNDFYAPPSTGVDDRWFTYEYIVEYVGCTVFLGGAHDFIHVDGQGRFAPQTMFHVLGGIWVADNPWVLESEVRDADASN